MVVDERSRHELYQRLEEVLGADAATTLIEHLPPVGWADVATKHDLAQLEERLELRFDRIDDRIDRVDDRFARVDEQFARVDERFTGFEERVDDRFTAFEARFELHGHVVREALLGLEVTFEHALRSQMTTLVFALVGTVLTMAGLAFALARFPA